jgi:hypothetical protein
MIILANNTNKKAKALIRKSKNEADLQKATG